MEPTHRFNDPINKTAWHTMSYSPDGEWLAGGAADSAAHKVYIWDLSNDGLFVSALDGGREPLTHLHVSIGFFFFFFVGICWRFLRRVGSERANERMD